MKATMCLRRKICSRSDGYSLYNARFYKSAWEHHSLGETCNIYTGGEAPPDSIKEKKSQGEYKYVILSNGIGENAIWGYSKSYRFNQPAITFSSIGSLGCPELKKEPFTPIIRLKVIIPQNEKDLDIKFLKYNLDIANFSNNASGIPNINAQAVKSIEYYSPISLEEQEKIGRLLGCLDSLCALHQREFFIICKYKEKEFLLLIFFSCFLILKYFL